MVGHFFVRGAVGRLEVKLQRQDGRITYATKTVALSDGDGWRKVAFDLTPDTTDPAARFLILASGGGKLVNTIDGTTPISIGAAGGSVIVSSAFNNWYDLTSTSFDVPRFGTDMLIHFTNDPTFGVLSLPVQGGTPGSGFTVRSKAYQIQMFLNGYFNPFF